MCVKPILFSYIIILYDTDPIFNGLPGCYKADTYLAQGEAEIPYIKHLSSLQECQYKCQQIATCNFFTYNPQNQQKVSVCYLRVAIAKSTPMKGFITGTKFNKGLCEDGTTGYKIAIPEKKEVVEDEVEGNIN